MITDGRVVLVHDIVDLQRLLRKKTNHSVTFGTIPSLASLLQKGRKDNCGRAERGLMNSTIDDRTREAEGDLDEPRFDEEATLLAAQPVVPLVEVKAKTRSRARFALALAIGGGLLIGLLAATLLYRYVGVKEPAPAETTAVTEQPETNEPQSYAGGATVTGDETAALATEATEAEDARKVAPEIEKPKVAQDPGPQPQVAPKPRPVIVRDLPDRTDDEEIDRAMRRAERQAERRERRRAAREAKRQNRDPGETTDDLLRIREIFEGAPRP